jgi:hypothetical protein
LYFRKKLITTIKQSKQVAFCLTQEWSMNIATQVSSVAPRRLTFNFPALRHYFDNQDKSGVSIKVEGDSVFIKPAWYTGTNSLELVMRGEHGKQILLEGSLADQVIEVLLASGDTTNRPFFVMKSAKGGWIRLEHYNEDDAPKLVPHVRLWTPRTQETAVPRMLLASNVPPDIQPMLTEFVVQISACQEKVRIFESQRRVGRPPRDVMDAKFVLTSFVRLASGIPPELQISN